MQRLQKHAEFVAVLRHRTKVASRDFVVHYSLRGFQQEPMRRLGLAVNKNVGNAVARNRAKRRIRVLARQAEGLLPPGVDIIVRALPSINLTVFADLEAQMARAFTKVSERTTGQEARRG